MASFMALPKTSNHIMAHFMTWSHAAASWLHAIMPWNHPRQATFVIGSVRDLAGLRRELGPKADFIDKKKG
jgi:hypothetical protein